MSIGDGAIKCRVKPLPILQNPKIFPVPRWIETSLVNYHPGMPAIKTYIAVVGAGPIGLELAVALKKAGYDYLHFDARQIGYTISWFAPQTRFFSSNERIAIAGMPLQTADQAKATREEYLAYLRSIVQMYDLHVRTYEPVVRITRTGDGFEMQTSKGGGHPLYHARRIVLCTGGTDHPRLLNIPGEDLPHVDHYFKDPHQFFRKKLLIVGGKNSAVEAALRCHAAGAKVSISYRRDKLDANSIKYWLMPEINGLISAGRIDGLFQTVPVEITPSLVKFKNTATGELSTDSFDFVLLLIGYEADMSLLRCAGVELNGQCQLPTYSPETMETNVPGLYVAGCAIGGTQDKYAVFLENCHIHIPKILASLRGEKAEVQIPVYARPES
jgi:thioredoxin reductase (NADPH)